MYNETKPLYIETDVSEVGLVASLCRQEAAQAALKMKQQTTTFSDPLYLWARACQM